MSALTRWGFLFVFVLCARAQTICPPTPEYGVCDITFDGGGAKNVEVVGEFRGPSHKTFRVRSFTAGGRTILRFSPFEAGTWDVRLVSSVPPFNGKQIQFTASPSNAPGWILAANMHHFRYSEMREGHQIGHLWVGDMPPAGLDANGFETWLNDRAKIGLTHVRLPVPKDYDENHWADFDVRAAMINNKGIIADLVVVPPSFPQREQRQAFFRYLCARAAARNATWILLDHYESYENSHEMLREMAGYLDEEDPYHRIRTAGAAVTSGPFADEPWQNFRFYGSPDWKVAAVEQEVYGSPAVSLVEASSADEFRHRLWNISMTGAYPETATLDAPSVKALDVWRQLFAAARHWELEPFFDAEGIRGVALPGTEYILYVENPGPVTVHLEQKRSWDVEWINPITGERIEIKKFKDETFTGDPPDASHDWVLHISREGQKESMLKSYRFESRPVILQEVEVDPKKVPFEIEQPSGGSISGKAPVRYAAKLTKETRATKNMIFVWTGEVTADGENYRVLGTEPNGTFQVPSGIVKHEPASLHMRVYGLNGYGKLYTLDSNFVLTQ
jgi:hypothetical protein